MKIFMLTRLFACICILASAPQAAAQAGGAGLELGRATRIMATGERAFDLPLREEQGVIIDLTGITLPTVSASAVPTLRILDSAGKCLRAVQPYDTCPTQGLASELEQAAEAGTLRVAFRPEAGGTYRLVLELPQDAAVTGYELLVRERPLPAPIEAVRVDLCRSPPLPTSGGADDPCTRKHVMPESGQAYFQFVAEGDAPWVQVDMRSADFDSVVELLGPLQPGAAVELAPVIDRNDDYGSGYDSRLRTALPTAGTYVVLARSYSAGAGAGYNLAMRSFDPPAPRAMRLLGIGEQLDDTFAQDEFDPFHTYEVTGQAGQTLTIHVQSEIDTRLSAGFELNVFDTTASPPADFATLASNDDTCGLDPLLALRFAEAETVRVRVEPLGGAGAAGTYTIAAREGTPGCPPAPASSPSNAAPG